MIKNPNSYVIFLHIFRSNKINCSYRFCVECLNDVDCNGNRVCSNEKCYTREELERIRREAEERKRRREEEEDRKRRRCRQGLRTIGC